MGRLRKAVRTFDLPVLIVDDEPQVRSLIRTVLSKHGFRVVEARDALSALTAVQELDGAISLMVSDYSMGCGSFAFEAKAPSVNRIAGMRSVRDVRMRGDIDTPPGYLVGVR